MDRRKRGSETQKKMMDLLKDGMPHRREELVECLPEPEIAMLEMANAFRCVTYHVYSLRKTLRPRGRDIICQLLNKALHYRIVGIISFE